ncbi:MAG: hypothetical protein C4576_26510 [Desulfobacteraceae bacterium]|nr:MAG: hypothetical protein C4576_26510 [Desulfobacteraceae bacterium]
MQLKWSQHGATAKELHLLHVAALLERCDALVCNDTGLMHIAASVGTPVIGLFGPTDPSIYLPRQGHTRAVCGDKPDCVFRQRLGIRPSPCLGAGRCLSGEKSCILEIGVLEVLNAVEELALTKV